MAGVFDLPIVGPIIKNGVSTVVSGAVTAAGGYAGDLVIGAGNLVEQGGRTVGNGVSGFIGSYGEKINQYGNTVIAATAPGGPPVIDTVQKTAKQVSHTATNVTNRASNTASGVAKTAQKSLPAPVSNAQKTITNTATSATKALPSTVGGAQKAITGTASSATKALPSSVGGALGAPKPASSAVQKKAYEPYKPATSYKGFDSKSAAGTPAQYKPPTPGAPKPPAERKYEPYKPATSYKPFDSKSAAGTPAEFKPGGGYKSPAERAKEAGVGTGGYKPPNVGTAVGGAKSYAGAAAKPVGAATGAATGAARGLVGGAVGGAQNAAGKVRVSRESRPRRGRGQAESAKPAPQFF
ncbi:hypothetical protein W97_08333 [Coniosporium apollinis CBS 100218]|uniref:Uncharacterized protein n=1 Tax=Coniosporium apollinis (strain CBS 100218) TaxID=1168221 RepID=R7Z4R2_CONA1|nr:uncharacterized protein W97_08333 [Coniosporium apollinis CBS 100218]EON69147.1 hypothetical protein W97_08333 [Coniosporium apollinis CBS 100218]